jgi:hypothetical protein
MGLYCEAAPGFQLHCKHQKDGAGGVERIYFAAEAFKGEKP